MVSVRSQENKWCQKRTALSVPENRRKPWVSLTAAVTVVLYHCNSFSKLDQFESSMRTRTGEVWSAATGSLPGHAPTATFYKGSGQWQLYMLDLKV